MNHRQALYKGPIIRRSNSQSANSLLNSVSIKCGARSSRAAWSLSRSLARSTQPIVGGGGDPNVGVYKRPKAVLIAFAMACLQVVAWGQLYTGSITGIVSDASGTAVMGATVTLSDSGRGFRQTTKTDVSGRYLFQSLPPRE